MDICFLFDKLKNGVLLAPKTFSGNYPPEFHILGTV